MTVLPGERIVFNELPAKWQINPIESSAPLAFHQRLPGYAPSPLRELPLVAAELGVESVWLKDESSRFGLPAFKILGASWATYNALEAQHLQVFGEPIPTWTTIEDLRDSCSPLLPLQLVCATDGNHGRAVAWFARMLGLQAHILVPDDMAKARIDAIAGEGATVEVIAGSYDDAVACSSALAGQETLVISDTSWPGYETIPAWVIEGYTTMIREIEREFALIEEGPFDLAVVPVGVGALAAAVAGGLAAWATGTRPRLLSVEPTAAPCMLASIEAGRPSEVPGPHGSIMAGLNCGVPSTLAWPVVSRSFDAFIAIADERIGPATRLLAASGVEAGECGSAGLAALLAWKSITDRPIPGKRVLLFSTEGPTNPAGYRELIGG